MKEDMPTSIKPTSETVLLNVAKSKPDGISIEDIQNCLPNLALNELTVLLNKCLKNGSLELLKSRNQLYYKFKDVSQSSGKDAVRGIDTEEKLVYKIIEDANNKGIWIRDIRFKSNLNMTQLNKVLKSLETKKLIKAIKSVSASKKKVYMLFDLEPDSSVTGGAWYQDQDFESEFVDVLNVQCHRYLLEKLHNARQLGGGPLLERNRSYVTATDVHKYIADLKLSRVALNVDDIESILYTVVLDRLAERTESSPGLYLYRATNRFIQTPGIVKNMCGVCPIVHRCAHNGLINAKVCQYLSDWLDF